MGLVGAVALATTLASCSQPAISTATTTSPEPTVTKSANPVDWNTCKTFGSQLQQYADFILTASGGHVDSTVLATMGQYIGALRSESSPAIAGTITDYAVPYDAINAAVKGDGHLSLHSAGYKSALLAIMQYCTETVGYKISQ